MTPSADAEHRTDSDRTFEAFETRDGGIGVRNRLLVLPSVICSHIVADRIADELPGAVSAPHDHGCGQLGSDTDQSRRTFLGIGTNPNVMGVVVVGLGCETIQSDELAAQLSDLEVPVRELSIQSSGGSEQTVDRGIEAGRELLSDRADRQTDGTLGDLTVGIVSSDVRDSTVDAADPLVGEFAERVVDAGGRVVVAGTERLLPHTDDLRELAADDAARSSVDRVFDERRQEPPRTPGLQRRAAERSAEELTRSWNGLPIRDVLPYGERASHDSGVALVDAPAQFAEAATALAGAGAHVVLHATADGIPVGHPIVPVVKLTGEESTYRTLESDIDVDATRADVDDLEETVRDVLGGQPSCAERHGLTEFAVTRVGPSM
ncbi:UxaA family hydrolase [Natrarchaeobius sp. A-rgal3]|uniref:UxaA family hydrolase n=1 Tax=Natrarchaeobius versutus TaxID=1679078 RepID=UPI0035109F72